MMIFKVKHDVEKKVRTRIKITTKTTKIWEQLSLVGHMLIVSE